MTQKEIILLDLFEDAYSSPTEFADILDLGLEMLFYVEEGAFSQRELQRVAGALRDISGVLRGKHLDK